jgi:hypothetical protein
MAKRRSGKKWAGGYVRTTSDGRSVWYIHKRVGGVRWKKALSVANEDQALVELAGFLKNPRAYCEDVALPAADEPLLLDGKLVKAYLAHAAAPRSENGRENGRKWLKAKGKMLAWWTSVLVDANGRPLDLRRVELARHVLPALETVKGKRHRREAIKALYAWLAAIGRIRPSEDPVARLPVGQGRVAQTQSGKDKRVPREHILKVINHLLIGEESRYGHALGVSAVTGWHVTEVERFVQRGTIIEPVPLALQEPGAVAILSTPHKSGKQHYTKVGKDGLFAAKELLAGRRGFSVKWYVEAVKVACRALELPLFSPAWMRHTNATHAVEQRGVSDLDAGKFLGHADGNMVHQVYGVLRTPPKVPTILDAPAAPPAPQPDVAALVEEVKRLREEVEGLRAKPKRARG